MSKFEWPIILLDRSRIPTFGLHTDFLRSFKTDIDV